jgi:hypothetical protein
MSRIVIIDRFSHFSVCIVFHYFLYVRLTSCIRLLSTYISCILHYYYHFSLHYGLCLFTSRYMMHCVLIFYSVLRSYFCLVIYIMHFIVLSVVVKSSAYSTPGNCPPPYLFHRLAIGVRISDAFNLLTGFGFSALVVAMRCCY